MRILRFPILAAIATTMFALSARADLIDPVHYSSDRPANNSPTTQESWVSDKIGMDVFFLGRYGPQGNIGSGEDPFGLLSGGDIQVMNYDNSDDQSVNLWWDLTGTGYELWAVFLKSGTEGDTLYQVSLDQKVTSNGWQTADLLTDKNGLSHISFFGKEGESVPDGGTTLALLGASLMALAAARRRLRR